ncbi:MAG: hypothetical protein HDR37_11595 [Treponema sp.]|nr:hypothetical protein [Treponema sp.]
MKDKVLFANAGVAKFMALLVTLLTMFASCNFVGGQDARNVIDGVTPPPLFNLVPPPFKSLMGAALHPWTRNWGDNSPLFKEIVVREHGVLALQPVNNFSGSEGGGYFAGVFGALENAAEIEGVYYDLSNVAYAEYEVRATEEVAGVSITLTGPETSDEVKKEAAITLTTNWQKKRISAYYDKIQTGFVALLFCGGDTEPKATVDTIIYIRNFTFYDANGNEVVPQLVGAN